MFSSLIFLSGLWSRCWLMFSVTWGLQLPVCLDLDSPRNRHWDKNLIVSGFILRWSKKGSSEVRIWGGGGQKAHAVYSQASYHWRNWSFIYLGIPWPPVNKERRASLRLSCQRGVWAPGILFSKLCESLRSINFLRVLAWQAMGKMGSGPRNPQVGYWLEDMSDW